MSYFKVNVVGDEELIRAINKAPKEMATALAAAGSEAAKKVVLETVGLQKYPPKTKANLPPVPYYRRGLGMQRSKSYNDKKSENLGKHWTVTNISYRTVIANPVSYAHWVHGDDQARVMASYKWRKLKDVVQEKFEIIRQVYSAWVERAIRKAGL